MGDSGGRLELNSWTQLLLDLTPGCNSCRAGKCFSWDQVFSEGSIYWRVRSSIIFWYWGCMGLRYVLVLSVGHSGGFLFWGRDFYLMLRRGFLFSYSDLRIPPSAVYFFLCFLDRRWVLNLSAKRIDC